MAVDLIHANMQTQINRFISHLGNNLIEELRNSSNKLIINFNYNPGHKRRNVSGKYDVIHKRMLSGDYYYQVSSYYRYKGYQFVVNKFLNNTDYAWLKSRIIFKGIKNESQDAITFIKTRKVKISPKLGDGDGVIYFDGGGRFEIFRDYLLKKLIPELNDELILRMSSRNGLILEGLNYKLLSTHKSIRNIKTPVQIAPYGFNQLIINRGRKKLIITYTYCLYGDQAYQFTRKAVNEGVTWVLFSGACGKLKNVNLFDNVKPVKFNFMPESREVNELLLNNNYPAGTEVSNVNVQGLAFEFPIKLEGFDEAATFEELRSKGDVVDVETALIALATKNTNVNVSISLVVTDDPEDINQLFRPRNQEADILIQERYKKLDPVFNRVREKQFNQVISKVRDYFQ